MNRARGTPTHNSSPDSDYPSSSLDVTLAEVRGLSLEEEKELEDRLRELTVELAEAESPAVFELCQARLSLRRPGPLCTLACRICRALLTPKPSNRRKRRTTSQTTTSPRRTASSATSVRHTRSSSAPNAFTSSTATAWHATSPTAARTPISYVETTLPCCAEENTWMRYPSLLAPALQASPLLFPHPSFPQELSAELYQELRATYATEAALQAALVERARQQPIGCPTCRAPIEVATLASASTSVQDDVCRTLAHYQAALASARRSFQRLLLLYPRRRISRPFSARSSARSRRSAGSFLRRSSSAAALSPPLSSRRATTSSRLPHLCVWRFSPVLANLR